jgi:DNA-binding response OmpR family regulator
LALYGYVVDAAEDGVAGWQALRANTYDLLITDHSMPRMTGLELVKKLRSARLTFPVILASGGLPNEVFEQPPWLQPAAILVKPFTPRQLLATVEAALRPAHRCATVAPQRQFAGLTQTAAAVYTTNHSPGESLGRVTPHGVWPTQGVL